MQFEEITSFDEGQAFQKVEFAFLKFSTYRANLQTET